MMVCSVQCLKLLFQQLRKKNEVYPTLIILLVISVITEAIVFIQVLDIEKHIRSVLMLLLHCKQSWRFLQGNFSHSIVDVRQKSNEFYDSIFKLLPDIIVICDQMYDIIGVSKASERIFKMKTDDIIWKNIKDFQFIGECDELFNGSNNVEIKYKDQDGSILN